MYAFSFLSMLTKESVSLAIIMLGIYLFVVQKEKIKGIILAVTGVAWFLIIVFFVIPYMAEGGIFWAWEWFKLSSFSSPTSNGGVFDIGLIINRFIHPDAISYYLSLLKPFGFLPLVGFPWLFISLPDIFINTVSSQGQMRSIVFHYDSVAVVGLVMATILGWRVIEIIFRKFRYVGWMVGILLLAAAFRTNYNYSPLPTTPSYWRPMYAVGADEIAFEKVLREIPADASITASSEVRTHLTHRTNAYNLPNMVENVDYVAMVDQNRIVGDYNPKEFETQLIQKLLLDPKFEKVFQQGHFWLFRRR
jgi:uncharacterized membrane protein